MIIASVLSCSFCLLALIIYFVTMGESQTVVAQTSAIMGHTSSGYSSSDFGNTSSDTPAAAGGALADGASRELAASADTTTGDLAPSAAVADAASTIPDVFNVGTGAFSTDLNSVFQGPATSTNDSKPSDEVANSSENLAVSAATSVDSSQVASYHSTITGNDVSEARNIVFAAISENGNPSDDVHGSALVHQPVDGSGMPISLVCSICLKFLGCVKVTCMVIHKYIFY